MVARRSRQRLWFLLSWPVGGHGRAGLVAVSERKPYHTDLYDEQWALVEPVTTAWEAAQPSVSGIRDGTRAGGRQRTALPGPPGCQWDLFPHDFPPARRGEVLLLHLAR